jgi:hypothetical protein
MKTVFKGLGFMKKESGGQSSLFNRANRRNRIELWARRAYLAFEMMFQVVCPRLQVHPFFASTILKCQISCFIQLRPMIRVQSATDAPDFKSPSRHAKGGLKDKQMGDFILIMGLMFQSGEIMSTATSYK